MEAYQHVFNKSERDDLAQIMYSLMVKRPRFDMAADYFLKTYRLESICLRQQAALIKSILDTQVCTILLTLTQTPRQRLRYLSL